MSKMFLITERVLYKTWIQADSEEEAESIYDEDGRDEVDSWHLEIEEVE